MAECSITSAPQAAALLGAVLVMALPCRSLAQTVRPTTAPAPLERFQPDLNTCNAEGLLAAHASALTPFADQPPAVLDQLRGLQRQLSARTLRRCLEQDLLSPEQVETLMVAMGMAVSVGPQPAPGGSSQRP
jgi:hypothetical protein